MGVVFMFAFFLPPENNMDGVELETCLRSLHPEKPVLILNCKESGDTKVVQNVELARRLGLFVLTNPFAVSTVQILTMTGPFYYFKSLYVVLPLLVPLKYQRQAINVKTSLKFLLCRKP